LFTQLGAQDGLLEQILYRVEPLFDLYAIECGPEKALPEQTATHSGESLIESGQHGGLLLRTNGIGGK
jgi:hypothetical protein